MWGVRGRVVKVVDLEPLALLYVEIPPRILNSVVRGSYPASLWNVGGSTRA